MFACGLLGGVVLAWARRIDEAGPWLDPAMGVAIAGFAGLALVTWAVFAGFTHVSARAFRGRGALDHLVSLSAEINAPLLVASSALWLVPRGHALMAAVYGYWLVLHVVAARAVYGLSTLRAVMAVALALALVGAIFVALVALVAFAV
jgi:hypothetical protein